MTDAGRRPHAFGVLDEVLDDYENFVKRVLETKDPQIQGKVEKEIPDDLLWPKPWLALNPAFEPGGTGGELVSDGVLDPGTVSIFRDVVRDQTRRCGRQAFYITSCRQRHPRLGGHRHLDVVRSLAAVIPKALCGVATPAQAAVNLRYRTHSLSGSGRSALRLGKFINFWP